MDRTHRTPSISRLVRKRHTRRTASPLARWEGGRYETSNDNMHIMPDLIRADAALDEEAVARVVRALHREQARHGRRLLS